MERPFAIDHLDHLVLNVRDLDKSVAFYSMLGGEVRVSRDGSVSLLMAAPATRITLRLEPDYVPRPLGNMDHVNFAVRAASVGEIEAYLRSRGARIVEELHREPTTPTVRVLDPDDNVVEIRPIVTR